MSRYQVVFVTPRRRVTQGPPTSAKAIAILEANEAYDALDIGPQSDLIADFVVIDLRDRTQVHSARDSAAEWSPE